MVFGLEQRTFDRWCPGSEKCHATQRSMSGNQPNHSNRNRGSEMDGSGRRVTPLGEVVLP
jgi:hypothetical protein